MQEELGDRSDQEEADRGYAEWIAERDGQSKQGPALAQSAPQPGTAASKRERHSVRGRKLPAASHRASRVKVQRRDGRPNLALHASREDASGQRFGACARAARRAHAAPPSEGGETALRRTPEAP